MALYTTDDYLAQPAIQLVDAIQLYKDSLTAFDESPSPYLYPVYGLGGLPEAFSRVAAINGGIFMLNRTVDEILFDSQGKAWGIRGGNADRPDEVAKATMFIGDPSYFPPSMVRATGQIVRSICFLNHPIEGVQSWDPKTKGYYNSPSGQIILPGSQCNRNGDIYISIMSKALMVCSEGLYLVILSTKVEGHENPVAELDAGIALIGDIMHRFDDVSDCYEPLEDGLTNKCFISKTYDETSHFQSAADDVLDMYFRVTGQELDMSIDPTIPQPGDY